MLNSNPIKLTENQTIAVRVKSPDGDFFNTDITLEYGKPPSIQLMLEIENELTAHPYKDDYRGNHYIMSNFYDRSFINHATFKYLFFGKANKDQIKEVNFAFPELSSYFQQELRYQLDREANITGKLKIEPLEARINSLGLSAKINQGYVLKRNDDNAGFLFQNTMHFSFESDTALSFSDIEKLMYKSIALITWVTGYSLSPDSITVSDGHETAYLYLPLVKKITKYDVSFSKCFMNLNFLRERFQTICNNYFEKQEIFEDIWSRTLPLFEFRGVMEYEVMLYASVLDRYFTHQVSKLELFKDQNYDSYFSKVKDFLNNSEDFKAILEGSDLMGELDVKGLFSNAGDKNFIQKQKAYFKHIQGDNLKIFIGKGDFYNIKDIRDRAAHGAKEGFETNDVYKYLCKVKLLTMYLIYDDLGIKEEDFFKIISKSYYPAVIGCELDRYLLDMATGQTILISLERREREKFDNLNTKVKVFQKKRNGYIFDSELSDAVSNYFSENEKIKFDPSTRIYSHKEYVQSLLSQRGSDLAVQYYHRIYLQEKSSKALINSVVIIS